MWEVIQAGLAVLDGPRQTQKVSNMSNKCGETMENYYGTVVGVAYVAKLF